MYRLRKFETVYPAAGNGHTAVRLILQELEATGAEGWVDVCKEPEEKTRKKFVLVLRLMLVAA